MEDTQMSSADVPQAPQPDANPAPAPQAEAPQTPAPKKGGVIMKALIGVFAVAIVGFGGWYAYNSGISGAAEDTPPSLSLGAAGFQGKSVETTFGFLQLDHADVSAHVDRPGSVYMTSETGVRWFYPKANTTFGEIESAFKPIAGMKILMAFYDAEEPWPGDSDGIKKGCFVTYPIGPYQHTCLGDLETPIDKNRGLAVITNIPSVGNVTPVFEYDSTLLGDAKTLSDGLTLPDLEGWTLHPFAAGMDLTDSKIRSVWTQTNAAEIKTQVTDVSSVDTSSEYKMMWLRLGDPVDPGTTTGGGETPPGICGDGTVDAGEECDDGNTTDGDGCSATCTTEAVCGDGNVDSGEECDGGTDCGTDCKLTSVVTVVCGNDTIDGTDVCDGTDLGGKDCTDYTNTNGSAFTGGTLECAADCLAYDTSACTLCGDGIKAGTEECDDGNTSDTDDCLNTCVFATCGDGIANGTEECDDGNSVNGDACENDCTATPIPDGGGSDPSNYYTDTSGANVGTYVGSGGGAPSGGSLITVGPPPGGGAPTESGVQITNIGYIQNIGNYLPISTANSTYAFLIEDLFDNRLETQIDVDNPSPAYIREDSQANTVVVAVKVDVSSGSSGPAILKRFGFLTTGFKNSEGPITMLDGSPIEWWCTGSTGGWELYKLTTDPIHGFALRLAMTHPAGDPNPAFLASLPSDLSQVLPQLKVESGEWAIFALVMHNMDSCHDESVSNNLYSRSKTDLYFKFVDEDGLNVKGPDNQPNPLFSNDDIAEYHLPRWTFWE